MQKISLYSLILMPLFICSTQPADQSVLAWAKGKPIITFDQLKQEIDNFISTNAIDLQYLSKGTFYELNMEIFNKLLQNYFLETIDPISKQKFEGISLFLTSVGNDITTITDQINKNINNNEERNNNQFMGFYLNTMNQKIIEISCVARWIEMYAQEVKEIYEKNKQIITDNNLNIYVPPFDQVKNIIGLFQFYGSVGTFETNENINELIRAITRNNTVETCMNQRQIKINYSGWRTLIKELGEYYHLPDNIEFSISYRPDATDLCEPK